MNRPQSLSPHQVLPDELIDGCLELLRGLGVYFWAETELRDSESCALCQLPKGYRLGCGWIFVERSSMEIKTAYVLEDHLPLTCRGWTSTMPLLHLRRSSFTLLLVSWAGGGDSRQEVYDPLCHVATLYRTELNHAQRVIANISVAIHWSTTNCTGDFVCHGSTGKSNFRAELCYSMKFQLWVSKRRCRDPLVTIPPHSAAFKRRLNNVIKQPPWWAVESRWYTISSLITEIGSETAAWWRTWFTNVLHVILYTLTGALRRLCG